MKCAGSYECIFGEALDADDPCRTSKTLSVEVQEVLDWMCRRSAEEVREHREAMCVWFERMAEEFHASGTCAEWYKESDPAIRRLGRHVNGPLMDALIEIAEHGDVRCPLLFLVCTCVSW